MSEADVWSEERSHRVKRMQTDTARSPHTRTRTRTRARIRQDGYRPAHELFFSLIIVFSARKEKFFFIALQLCQGWRASGVCVLRDDVASYVQRWWCDCTLGKSKVTPSNPCTFPSEMNISIRALACFALGNCTIYGAPPCEWNARASIT